MGFKRNSATTGKGIVKAWEFIWIEKFQSLWVILVLAVLAWLPVIGLVSLFFSLLS